MNPVPKTGDPRAPAVLPPAIEVALGRCLPPPPLPPRLHAAVQAAIAGPAPTDLAALRARYEQEQAQRLLDLRHDYVRLRRRALACLVGGAFAAGAAAALAMPWFVAHFGAMAPVVLAGVGAAAGLALAGQSWLRNREAFSLRA